MELRQLVYLEAVVRHGGFGRAADRLRIAQPAISAQIKRLEGELGTRLLERTTRRVALTAAGELFLARAREVLLQLDSARADLDDLAGLRRGVLRIGAAPLLGPLQLPALLARFHQEHPGIDLSLRTALLGELLGDLEAGALDVVLGPLHADLPDRLVTRSLAAESVVLVTPPGRRSVSGLADVRDEPFVCLPPGSGLRAILDDAAAVAGFTPRVPFQADTPAAVRGLVAAGLGVALLAASTARAAGPPVAVHRLTPAPQHPPIGVIRVGNRPLSPAELAWWSTLASAGRGRPSSGPAIRDDARGPQP